MITQFIAVMFQQVIQGALLGLGFVLPQVLVDSLAAIGPVFNNFFQYTPTPVAAVAALFALHFGTSLGFSVVFFAIESYKLVPFKAA